jgi:hypothetical protein
LYIYSGKLLCFLESYKIGRYTGACLGQDIAERIKILRTRKRTARAGRASQGADTLHATKERKTAEPKNPQPPIATLHFLSVKTAIARPGSWSQCWHRDLVEQARLVREAVAVLDRTSGRLLAIVVPVAAAVVVIVFVRAGAGAGGRAVVGRLVTDVRRAKRAAARSVAHAVLRTRRMLHRHRRHRRLFVSNRLLVHLVIIFVIIRALRRIVVVVVTALDDLLKPKVRHAVAVLLQPVRVLVKRLDMHVEVWHARARGAAHVCERAQTRARQPADLERVEARQQHGWVRLLRGPGPGPGLGCGRKRRRGIVGAPEQRREERVADGRKVDLERAQRAHGREPAGPAFGRAREVGDEQRLERGEGRRAGHREPVDDGRKVDAVLERGQLELERAQARHRDAADDVRDDVCVHVGQRELGERLHADRGAGRGAVDARTRVVQREALEARAVAQDRLELGRGRPARLGVQRELELAQTDEVVRLRVREVDADERDVDERRHVVVEDGDRRLGRRLEHVGGVGPVLDVPELQRLEAEHGRTVAEVVARALLAGQVADLDDERAPAVGVVDGRAEGRVELVDADAVAGLVVRLGTRIEENIEGLVAGADNELFCAVEVGGLADADASPELRGPESNLAPVAADMRNDNFEGVVVLELATFEGPYRVDAVVITEEKYVGK